MALEQVAREHRNGPSTSPGGTPRGYDLPVPRTSTTATMQITELNEIYNQCAVGLVLSLTNMSLLPLELLASGVIPVAEPRAEQRQGRAEPLHPVRRRRRRTPSPTR